ncbi:diacylglycerol kinase family protein [Chitinophagaceae bacterium MMS25-I14]
MKNLKQMTLRSRAGSLRYAFAGISYLLKKEPNMRIHALASLLVIVAGICRHITTGQWTSIVLCIALVWFAEAVNTALELTCDLYTENRYHPLVKNIKDIAAGAVLILSVGSVAVALFIFL